MQINIPLACVFGGTFDPPHAGHANLASAVINLINPEIFCIMPNRIPPHKAMSAATSEDRLAMCRIFASSLPNATVLENELRRDGPSYLADTLTELSEQPEFSGKRIIFVVGADSVEQFHRWSRPELILSICSLVAVPRPGYSFENAAPWVKDRFTENKELLKGDPGKIFLARIPEIDLSSSKLRNNPHLMKNFLSSDIYEYAACRGLYGLDQLTKCMP